MNHKHGYRQPSTKKIKASFFINVTFTIIELVGGVLTNSVAILSDAAHDLGDSISLGIAWWTQKLAQKSENEDFTYGYRRYSVIGAIVNIFVLFAGAVFVLSESIPRLINPEEVNTQGMFLISILGIIFNGAAVFILKKGESLNERVVSLHLMEDVLGWVGIFIGSLVMMFYDLPIIDPILSILISIYILFNLYKNSRGALDVILQRTPRTIEINDVEDQINSFESVIKCDDIHVWSLDGEYNIMSSNVYVHPELTAKEIDLLIKSINHSMKKLDIQHCTIEIKV